MQKKGGKEAHYLFLYPKLCYKNFRQRFPSLFLSGFD